MFPTQQIASGVVSALIGDAVAVYDQNFRQVFSNARPLKVSPSPSNKLMQHPIETGATTTDHAVTLPVTIELSLIVMQPFLKSTYEQIAQLSQKKTLLTVQTKAATYSNMAIQGTPHVEDGELFDAITIAMKLEQVLFSQVRFSAVKNPTNSSTKARGNVQTIEASAGKSQSVIKSAKDYVAGKF